MRKVLFFLESLAGGGAEKVLAELVTHLDPDRFDVTVMTVTDGDLYEEKVRASCRYHSFLHRSDYEKGGFHKLLFWLGIKMIYHLPPRMVYRFFIKETYDVEAAFIEGFATRLIGSSPNKKSDKLAWIHIDVSKNIYADKIFRNYKEQLEIYRRFKTIVCVSESVKHAFEKKFFTAPNVRIQYNPVNEAEIERLSNESVELARPAEGILLGTIGRLEEQKGYLRLIKAAAEVQKRGYAFTIWIIGQGSLRDEIECDIEKYHLEEKIRLLGFQENPYKYLKQCDAFICSSYAEGFSTAATESLLLEKPIFTVECAGMRELFGTEACGEIVPNTDASLMMLLEHVVSGAYALETYRPGLRARKRAFTLDRRMREIEALLADDR